MAVPYISNCWNFVLPGMSRPPGYKQRVVSYELGYVLRLGNWANNEAWSLTGWYQDQMVTKAMALRQTPTMKLTRNESSVYLTVAFPIKSPRMAHGVVTKSRTA